MDNPPYRETSKIFSPWFIFSFLPVLAVAVFLGWEGYHKQDYINMIGGILTFCCSGTVLLLLLMQKMTLIIGREGILYNYYPAIRKFRKIKWADVQSVEIITYNPIRDFGGWGFKVSKKYGKGYTTRGNKGMWIRFVDGKTVFLTILNPAKAKEKIQVYSPHSTISIKTA